MTPAAQVAVVIVTWQSRETVLGCLQALRTDSSATLDQVVVDNASTDDTAAAVRAAFPTVRVIEAGANLGFGAACNRGAAATTAPWVLFLNPDAEPRPGAIGALLARVASAPGAAAGGPLTRFPDGTPQLSFGPDLSPWSELRQRRLVRGLARRDPEIVRDVNGLVMHGGERDWVSGACLLVRRTAFEAVSGFDEGYFLYEEDADLCRRLRIAGGRVLHVPEAEVRHAGGASMAVAGSRARIAYHRAHVRYYRRWNGLLATTALRKWIALEAVALAARGRLVEARATLAAALSG